GVHRIAGLRQHVPHGRTGRRRDVVEQPGAAGHAPLLQGDGDVARHSRLLVRLWVRPPWAQAVGRPAGSQTSASTSDQMPRPSSISAAVTTNGGIIRTVFMYAPQVSISRPLAAAACWAAAARALSGRPSGVVNSEPTSRP